MTTIVPNTRKKNGAQKFRRLRLGDWFHVPIDDSYTQWVSEKKSKTRHLIFKSVKAETEWTPKENETYYYYDFVEKKISCIIYKNDKQDIYNLNIGNCFKHPNDITHDEVMAIISNMEDDLIEFIWD